MSRSFRLGLVGLIVVTCLCVVTVSWRTLTAEQHQNDLNTKLIAAVKAANVEAVSQVLKEGANPNTFQTFDKSQQTQPVIRLAVSQGMKEAHQPASSLQIARILVDAGADVNLPDFFKSLLQTGDLAFVEQCLAKGAKPTPNSLNEAIRLGDPALVRKVLSLRRELNTRFDVYDSALPLNIAAQSAGKDADRQKERLEIGKMLLDKGAVPNPTLPNPSAAPPLSYAAFNGNIAFMELLLQRGADVKFRNAQGETTLHYAAMRKDNAEAIRWLIAHGADIHAKDKDGKTPLDWAKTNKLEAEEIALLTKR